MLDENCFTEAPKKPTKSALRIMRNLYEATGGKPQRWESLGNLGAVKADASGIAYAVERGWLRISGGLHSVNLTEDGRRGPIGRSPRQDLSGVHARERLAYGLARAYWAEMPSQPPYNAFGHFKARRGPRSIY